MARALTVARVQSVEIALHWRWAPVLVLATWLLAHDVLPSRFPGWELATDWVTSAAAVLAGEAALLLHEFSHALLARWYGRRVTRIVFHGFLAETIVDDYLPLAGHTMVIAVVGPVTNLLLAILALGLQVLLSSEGPLEVFLLMLVLGNLAAAVLSLVPFGRSDGARALEALRATRS